MEADDHGLVLMNKGGKVRNRLTWDVREYKSIDSTNLEARRLLKAGSSAGLVVTADHQTMGRGRMGRSWLDLPRKSLMVSLVLEGVGGFEAALLVSLSARAAIVKVGGEGPCFKWPNDLVYGNGKAGGVLSESCGVGGKEYVITGLGLNIGYLPGELDIPTGLPATSLLIEEGRIWDRGELLHAMLRELDARWVGSRDEWMREYRANLAFLGETVGVKPPFSTVDTGVDLGEEIAGIMEGVDDGGNLLLRVGDRVLRIVSGDFLIR